MTQIAVTNDAEGTLELLDSVVLIKLFCVAGTKFPLAPFSRRMHAPQHRGAPGAQARVSYEVVLGVGGHMLRHIRCSLGPSGIYALTKRGKACHMHQPAYLKERSKTLVNNWTKPVSCPDLSI